MSNEKRFILDVLHNKPIDFDKVKENINFKEVLNLSLRNKIFFHVFDFIENFAPLKEFDDFYSRSVSLNENNNVLFKHICMINKLFSNNNILFLFTKGMVLSKLIYSDPFFRLSSDIDILVDEKSLLKACEIMESLGFCEENAYVFSKYGFENKRDYYLNKKGELVFCKGNVYVELKTKIVYFKENLLQNAKNRLKSISINNTKIPCFDVRDNFINLMLNSYKNLCTPYGIECDHRLSDLIDYYHFCVKFNHIFTKEFSELLCNEYLRELNSLYKLLNDFYSVEEMNKLPLFMHELTPTPILVDDMVWENININDRFFDAKKRKYFHHVFRFKNQIKKGGQSEKIYSDEHSNKKPWTVLPNDTSGLSSFARKTQFYISYDKDYVKIILKTNKEEVADYKFVVKYVVNEDLPQFKTFIVGIKPDVMVLGDLDLANVIMQNDLIEIRLDKKKLVFCTDNIENVFVIVEQYVWKNNRNELISSFGETFAYKRLELVK